MNKIVDQYGDVGPYWIALFCNKNTVIYFDSFGVEHVPEEIKNLLETKT